MGFNELREKIAEMLPIVKSALGIPFDPDKDRFIVAVPFGKYREIFGWEVGGTNVAQHLNVMQDSWGGCLVTVSGEESKYMVQTPELGNGLTVHFPIDGKGNLDMGNVKTSKAFPA